MDRSTVKEWVNNRLADKGYDLIGDDEEVISAEITAKEATEGCCEMCRTTSVEMELEVLVSAAGRKNRSILLSLWSNSVELVD